jgi:hypothetical protein
MEDCDHHQDLRGPSMTQTAELHPTQEQSHRYLASTSTGRVVVSSPDEVFVIPISYVFERDCLVFCISATYLKALADCERIAFHADGFDDVTSTGWSVTVRGSFSVIGGYGTLSPPAGFVTATPSWHHADETTLWVRLRTDDLDVRESITIDD